MDDFNIDKEKLRRKKEFVYDQWRKILTIFVVGKDISTNYFKFKDITPEELRTVFNNGYKLALLQTKQSLMDEIQTTADENSLNLMEKLIAQVEDRLETQKCFCTYKNDEGMLSDAIRREADFLSYVRPNMNKWGDDNSM